MDRTVSAKLRRSFAQFAKMVAPAARPRPRPERSLFIAVALSQSALIIGVAIFFALIAPTDTTAAAHLLCGMALLASGYVGFIVIGRSRSWPVEARALQQGYRSSDVEQLQRLRERISHELRTPLNAMIGFSDMMHQEVLGPVGNERYREYAAHIRNSAEHFQLATEKSLAVTELLTSPPSRLRVAINLAELIDASLEDFRATTVTSEPDWAVCIDTATVVDGNHAALQDALHHLWGVGRALAGPCGESARCTVASTPARMGYVDVHFDIEGCNAEQVATDTELAPGAELSLLLARLGIEAGGGVLTIETLTRRAWRATVRMPVIAERKLRKRRAFTIRCPSAGASDGAGAHARLAIRETHAVPPSSLPPQA